MATTFEPVGDDEIAEVASLITRSFRGNGWHSEEDLEPNFTLTEEELRTSKSRCMIMQMKNDSGKRLGAIVFRPLDEQRQRWRFGWFAVEPELQASGSGKALLAYSEQYAQQNGGKWICMTVINVRHNLIAWYTRRGYRPTGEKEPFQHAQDGKDNMYYIVMEKILQ